MPDKPSQIEKEKRSGRIDLTGDRLSYTPPRGTGWSVELTEIRLIAEETIEAMGDDWFIHLALQSEWYSFSFYAAGFQEVWDRIAERFPGIKMELSRSASFASRVLWPAQLHGQPLFDYQPEPNPPLWRRLTGSQRIESTLTSTVSGYLDTVSGAAVEPS